MNGIDLKKEFGDYQTPLTFAMDICSYLHNYLNIRPKKIIEPTSGLGSFIQASIEYFHTCNEFIGIEINSEYCSYCESLFNDSRVNIINKNFFDLKLDELKKNQKGQTLIIGNPPWVTNAKLNYNLPKKMNFKELSGIDAITGASNFDICEYIILDLINNFKNTDTVIAMLCKTSVARNIFLEIKKRSISIEYIKMINFDSNKIFKVNVPACLLVIKISKIQTLINTCEISDISNPDKIISTIKFDNESLSFNNDNILDFNGHCQFEWRQGIKHDCSSIMELKVSDEDCYINKKKELVNIEDNLVYPLVKSSDFKSYIINKFEKRVIVTQKKIKEDTNYIKENSPRTWEYLTKNREKFRKRKSSIYKNAPEFSMFGIGNYTYSKYKVGISGFYKNPIFSLLYNEENLEKPVMVDDTCYFLPFDNYDDAYVCMLLLNNKLVQEFIRSISFQDAKRPYTKKVLQRIDLKKITNKLSINDLKETEVNLGLYPYISLSIYKKFKNNLK